MYIHGGPAAQSVDSFNRFVQYIVNQGYPDRAQLPRLHRLASNLWMPTSRLRRRRSVRRLDAAEWIKKSGFVDPKKLIVMGGSYGGYLTMMAVTKAPDMWAAAVPIVPFVNWFTEICQRRPQPARVRPGDHGRSGEEQGAV